MLEVNNISKSFKDFNAVTDLSFRVGDGEIYGFLGPNGAGKSTSLRMISSLIKPSSGEIKINGYNIATQKIKALSNAGVLIEKPDFYGALSAITNLKLLYNTIGEKADLKRIQELIEIVGLKGRENDKVKTYSQGMKQRLGIAQTMLHNPPFIILDEPTNGLDPQGIINIRNLIISLKNDFNKTVLLSSHLLSEIEQVCTNMIIINKGRKIVEGKVKELLVDSEVPVVIDCEDVVLCRQILAQKFKEVFPGLHANELKIKCLRKDIPQLVKYLTDNSVKVYAIKQANNLEEYFLNMVH